MQVRRGEGESGVEGSRGWDSLLGPQSWMGTSPEMVRQGELGAATREVCSTTWDAEQGPANKILRTLRAVTGKRGESMILRQG